ncbi:MAG TPA: GH1 family beta-glucosidase [Oculatellaceae cyanobacterium]
MNNENFVFPRGFVWGTATASYQIEGACDADGKGRSIWDTFTHTPGKIHKDEVGDVACDHYNRYVEDVALMQHLNCKAYRFSISWPRIFPNGHGQINPKGLEFYDRLVDEMMQRGIEPYITLYHWDLPQALQEKGGWANRDTAGYFADYSAAVVKRLGDRVSHWITLNEPWASAHCGNVLGEHAPGLKDKRLGLAVAHHLLVGHGLALSAIRGSDSRAEVGIALNLYPTATDSQSPEALKSAEDDWNRNGRWFLDPIFRGCYPPIIYEENGADAVPAQPNDFALIGQKIDFLGINYYFRHLHNENGRVEKVPGSEHTDMGWEVHAPSLRDLLNRINADYKLPPIYITENGCALQDHLTETEHVHDNKRIKFIHDHLVELRRAMRDGVVVRGYFVWSLMDNFEWSFGTSKRFGLVYVDFKTQRRYVKDSGFWFAKVVQRNEVHK